METLMERTLQDRENGCFRSEAWSCTGGHAGKDPIQNVPCSDDPCRSRAYSQLSQLHLVQGRLRHAREAHTKIASYRRREALDSNI